MTLEKSDEKRDDEQSLLQGLTVWGDGMSAQVRDGAVVIYDRESSTETTLGRADAVQLRNLLNVATARGQL